MSQDQPTIAEQTLQRLTESMLQQAASAISAIAVPEFHGKPNEDVRAFLNRFKVATLALNDELRCLALNKALCGAAHVWAKTNIKNLMLIGDWKQIKRALVARFEAQDRELIYRGKLSKMTFDPEESTLTAYVEAFMDCHRKAHKGGSDKDAIKALKINLPNNIIRNLNLLNDNWSEFSSSDPLFGLIKRVESNIIPYEPKDESNVDKLTTESLTRILKEFKDNLVASKKEKEEEKNENTEALAAIRQVDRPDRPEARTRVQPIGYRPYRGAFQGRKPGPIYNNRYDQGRRFREDYRPFKPRETRVNPEERMESPSKEKLQEAYYSRYGKPPGPCQICGEGHFNRHCPFQDLN